MAIPYEVLDAFPLYRATSLPRSPEKGDLDDIYVVLVNGPPGAGKDTAGRALCTSLTGDNIRIMKMARRLKESVHADYGMPNVPHDYFEDCKDEPHPAFFGKTPRQAYIDKSELMIKPVLGDQFYGKIFLRDLLYERERGLRMAIITDTGFASECVPLLEIVPTSRILLLRVHAESRGKSFAGDSRSYIDLPGILTVDLENVAQAQFEGDVRKLVYGWARSR